MSSIYPMRLRLSRAKGFNLKALSHAMNGLEVVKVARPGFWGNPFTITNKMKAGTKISGGLYIAVPTIDDAIACYRLLFEQETERANELRKRLPELRGKNLACWCPYPALGTVDRCHAAILLELANR